MSTATLQEPISDVMDDELFEVIDGIRVRTPPMAAIARTLPWVRAAIGAESGVLLWDETDIEVSQNDKS